MTQRADDERDVAERVERVEPAPSAERQRRASNATSLTRDADDERAAGERAASARRGAARDASRASERGEVVAAWWQHELRLPATGHAASLEYPSIIVKLRDNARFSTICIHAGQEPDPSTGAIITPIYQTSTYVQDALGVHKGYEYARTQNPTRAALEANIAAIENGKRGVRVRLGHGGRRAP